MKLKEKNIEIILLLLSVEFSALQLVHKKDINYIIIKYLTIQTKIIYVYISTFKYSRQFIQQNFSGGMFCTHHIFQNLQGNKLKINFKSNTNISSPILYKKCLSFGQCTFVTSSFVQNTPAEEIKSSVLTLTA